MKYNKNITTQYKLMLYMHKNSLLPSKISRLKILFSLIPYVWLKFKKSENSILVTFRQIIKNSMEIQTRNPRKSLKGLDREIREIFQNRHPRILNPREMQKFRGFFKPRKLIPAKIYPIKVRSYSNQTLRKKM